ncbi:Ras family protein [Aphelenchoides fujianensis]|nr:Ras family protein [Aphelenchoides fujianensis]
MESFWPTTSRAARPSTRLHRWIEDVSKFAVPNVAKILIGTKEDLQERRAVETDDGHMLAKSHNMIDFLEVSSKNNVNVDAVFTALATQLKSQYDVGNIVDNHFDSFRLNYDDTTTIPRRYLGNCCGFQ